VCGWYSAHITGLSVPSAPQNSGSRSHTSLLLEVEPPNTTVFTPFSHTQSALLRPFGRRSFHTRSRAD